MTSQGMIRDRTSRQMLLAAIAAFVIGGAMIGYGIVTAITEPDPPAQVQTLVDDGGGRGGGGSF